MATSHDSRREQIGTYPVQVRSQEDEKKRLHLQDRLINASMGGLLPEQADPARFTSVLDVGCGTGGWLIELAKAYPHISRLLGVDVNARMLDFARAQAAAEGVGDRVEFYPMDALRMLEFPDAFFDLVNQRFGASWLRTWDWPRLLLEYLRVVRPKGVIRITEGIIPPTSSNSPTLMHFNDLMVKASYQAGHSFHLTRDGVAGELSHLLPRYGVQHVQTRTYALEYRAGTIEGQLFAEDMAYLFQTFKPFFQKWTHVPNTYEELHQRMLTEMRAPDFVATGNLLTAWGTCG